MKLGELNSYFYGNHGCAGKRGKVGYLVYSSIAFNRAEEKQNMVYCVRELAKISVENLKHLEIAKAIKNYCLIVSAGLIGLILYSSIQETPLITESIVIILAIAAIIIFLANMIMQTYIEPYELIQELEADRITIEVMEGEECTKEEIMRYLRLSGEVNPLITENYGFKIRREALLVKKTDKKKKSWEKMWED